VASPFDAVPRMLTLTMSVQYVGAVVEEDAVAEGWIVRRGRSTVFCRAEVQTESGTLAATGELVYNVRAQPAA
jgi:acyl-coenzyme A thioesterase PaaI-like protein